MPALLTTPSTLPNSSIAVFDDVLGAVGVGHGIVVRHRAPPGLADLGDHLVGHRRPGAGAVARATEVVDHHRGPFAGQRQRVLTAETATGTGDHDNTICNSRHVLPS
jgi:hypothetical protein